MFGVYRTVAQVGMDEKERRLSATCANCGGPIPPNTQVAVMIGQGGQRLVCHAEYNCSPPGGAFYGFWGEGRLVSTYEKIEQC